MPAAARFAVFAALALLLLLTRVHHFAAIPDASWAVFFAAGFYSRPWLRWTFPLLMALAVAVDVAVTTAGGVAFLDSHCVSPGYWFLLPAYFSLSLGGAWLAGRRDRPAPRRLLELSASLLLAVVVCHAFAQGGFYWLSTAVAAPSVSGWLANYAHWLLPYLQTAALYTGLIVLLHAALQVLLRRAARPLDRETA
jgi:hypothetical protein